MSRRDAIARLHGTVPYKVLAGLGGASFVLDTLFVRLFPGWVDGRPLTVAMLYGATLIVVLVLVLILRAVLKPARLVEAVAVIAASAGVLHGLALALAPGLYGDASSAVGGAAWVLFGLGGLLLAGILFERRSVGR